MIVMTMMAINAAISVMIRTATSISVASAMTAAGMTTAMNINRPGI